MNAIQKTLVITAAIASLIGTTVTPAMAHRMWLLPSSQTLSGQKAWVTVDATVSNELFVFDHNAMNLDGLKITGPDGQPVAPQNLAKGKLRQTFDIELSAPGTYRVRNSVSMGLIRYMKDGKPERIRVAIAELNTAVPEGATEVVRAESHSVVESYVTLGAPTAIKPAGQGLEMVPITHPADVVAGEAVTFQFVLDGKPVAGIAVEVIKGSLGATRFVDAPKSLTLKTDAEGKVTLTPPEAGIYWLGAEGESKTAEGNTRRLRYVLTFEAQKS